MRRRALSWLSGALFALGAAASGAACSGSKGQIMFAFQTDMSLPKDIDAIRVTVTAGGVVEFDEVFDELGSDGAIKLPATLGFLTPDDPTQPVRLRVVATQGGEDQVRVLREVVTTVPQDRTAVLQVPIQFLCYGSGEPVRNPDGTVKRDAEGNIEVKSTCPEEGQTCKAGLCAAPDEDSAALPDYVPAQVFGGGDGDGTGLCFDTVRCFGEGASAEVETLVDADDVDGDGDRAEEVCVAAVPGGAAEINVAMLTQGGGICGDRACYVPMDAGSDAGWRALDGGRIQLPTAVCERAAAGKLLGLTVATASEGTCQKKSANLPTCGAWSASGAGQYTEPDEDQPLPVALGLRRPISLAVTAAGLYWIETGTFDAQGAPVGDGAVRWVPPLGGTPLPIQEGLLAPRELVVDPVTGVVFWTSSGAGADDGAIMAWVPDVAATIELDTGRQPEGIARVGDTLYWTELWGSDVLQATTGGEGQAFALQGEPSSLTDGAAIGASPYRVAAAGDVVCWSYQGELQKSDGAVACRRAGEAAQVIADQQSTPRAIALDVDAGGAAQAVYWASFEGGTIWRAKITGAGFEAAEALFEGQALPSGLAVDGEHVYWTNRGDGAVMRAPKDVGASPEVLASGQLRPGSIAVTAEAVYWLNEGSGGLTTDTLVGDGALMRLPKAPPAEM